MKKFFKAGQLMVPYDDQKLGPVVPTRSIRKRKPGSRKAGASTRVPSTGDKSSAT